jgi:hypothetical protein
MSSKKNAAALKRAAHTPPSAKQAQNSARSPKDRAVHVVQDEFVQDIMSTINFSSKTLPVNPGQLSTFPWLSLQAAQYERWTCTDLEFYYRPMVSQYAAGGQAGKIMMAIDYDAADEKPSSRRQLEAMMTHADAMPSQALRMKVNSRELMDGAGRHGKFVRPGAQPAGTDIRLYDGGTLVIATEGQTADALRLGELRVRYHFSLSVPHLDSAAVSVGAIARLEADTDEIGSGASVAVDLANVAYDGIGLVLDEAGNWIVPVGNYILDAGAQLAATGGDVLMHTAAQIWDYTANVALSSASKVVSAAAGQTHYHAPSRFLLRSDGLRAIGVRHFVVTNNANLTQRSEAHLTIHKI